MRIDHLYLLENHLRARFPSMDVLASMCTIFNVHKYPEDVDSLIGYGDAELDVVIDFYKHGWDDPERFSRRVKERWFLFRELLHYMRGEQVEEVVRVPVARDPSQESPFLDPAFQSVKKQVDLPISTVISWILSNPTIKAIFPEYQWLAEIYRAIAIASADPERVALA